jgi:hypothetical protein
MDGVKIGRRMGDGWCGVWVMGEKIFSIDDVMIDYYKGYTRMLLNHCKDGING